ncbi:MAG: hypothetical protein MUE33_06605 [Cytophagaceae bacterium]|jgi:hypothetical protein|nr:hypothetical protein [Cytophagaceae bacterium]
MSSSIIKMILTLSSVFLLYVLFPTDVEAQCAMCKAQLENKADAQNTGINSGILYLMIFPYFLIAVIAYLWYKHFKKAKSA